MVPTISLDLDDLWASLKTHGDEGWRDRPSFLGIVVPRALAFFAARGLRATIFAVGRDAADPRHRDVFSAIAEAGHEVGNHSFDHEPWFHLYSRDRARDQIVAAEEAIESATGRRPAGYRAPGFSFTRDVLEELALRGYRYDASVCPSSLGPLVTAYYLSTARFTGEARRRLGRVGGTLAGALRPSRPFRWPTAAGPLLEIPVSTFPFLRFPIHASYLQCLPRKAALACFATAARIWQSTGRAPSFLLHSTDFLGAEDTGRLSFVPGMGRSACEKLDLLDRLLDLASGLGRPVTLGERADDLSSLSLPIRSRPAPSGAS